MRLSASKAEEVNLEDLSSETVELITESAVFLGIDPGEKNGIAAYDKDYGILWTLTVKEPDMGPFIQKCENLQLVIIEDFFLYPHKAMAQSYSDMPTSRVIGRVEEIARTKGFRLIKQPAKIKPIGYKWIGRKPLPKSNPLNHELDAHVHFMHWAIKHGKIDVSSLL